MSASDAVLNIAVNFGRIARYLEQNNENRVKLFLKDCNAHLKTLEGQTIPLKLQKTYTNTAALIQNDPSRYSKNKRKEIIEDYYTWANILTHRAHLFH